MVKLYDRKTPITAADLLKDRVLPFFEQHGIELLRVLTDRGTEYCGNAGRHEYELYGGGKPRSHAHQGKNSADNGTAERFHKTPLDEFYRIASRESGLACVSATTHIGRLRSPRCCAIQLERPCADGRPSPHNQRVPFLTQSQVIAWTT